MKINEITQVIIGSAIEVHHIILSLCLCGKIICLTSSNRTQRSSIIYTLEKTIFWDYMLTRLLLFIVIIFHGCTGVPIPPDQYSSLITPEETYQFAKKAVARDDPEAFYYCLSESTQRQFSKSELKLGWALAGSFFYLFLDSKLKPVQRPAPEFGLNENTAKATIENKGLESSFLLFREDSKWRLVYPSPYPIPDIQQIKTKKRLPWRTNEWAHYQTIPEHWYHITPIGNKSPEKIERRIPVWRTETLK